jgi:hypothetical protein
MNKLEKIIYDLVKRTPWMKYLLRNLYQSFFDLLPKKKEYFYKPYQYRENFFFGFHDLDPFSADCKKILANHTSFDLRMPNKYEFLNIGYFDWVDEKMGEFKKLGVSYAWNYHKGCRLQWLSDSKVIFNSAINDKLLSIIVDINNRKDQIINYPIDTINQVKMVATSFSYERLERCMPGYGYQYQDEGMLNDYAPAETGLFIVDLRQNIRKLLISVADLVKELNDESFRQNHWHFVTHSEFSSDGRYVSFLHRWIGSDIKKRWTRLIIYDFKNNEWFVLPTTDWGVSHYIWNEKNQILAYCSVENTDSHVIFDIPSMKYKIIAANKLNSDGHQSFINSNEFITDTYPDKYRMAKLFRVDIKNDNVKLLSSVYAPKQFQTKTYYNHIACDLHPRVSRNGEYVCFDSPRTGKRAIYVMKIIT